MPLTRASRCTLRVHAGVCRLQHRLVCASGGGGDFSTVPDPNARRLSRGSRVGGGGGVQCGPFSAVPDPNPCGVSRGFQRGGGGMLLLSSAVGGVNRRLSPLTKIHQSRCVGPLELGVEEEEVGGCRAWVPKMASKMSRI